jgi:hypothetical protein
MRANGNLAGVEFIAPPMHHHHAEIWREIITESGYCFTKSAMKWFNSRVAWDTLTKLTAESYGFVSSEQDSAGAWNGERRYTVRRWNAESGVSDLSKFGEFGTLKAARKWLTRGGFTERSAA